LVGVLFIFAPHGRLHLSLVWDTFRSRYSNGVSAWWHDLHAGLDMFMKRVFAPACSGLYESVGLLHGGSRVKICLVVKKKLLSGFSGLLLSLIKVTHWVAKESLS
jgi:hypothetical protein